MFKIQSIAHLRSLWNQSINHLYITYAVCWDILYIRYLHFVFYKFLHIFAPELSRPFHPRAVSFSNHLNILVKPRHQTWSAIEFFKFSDSHILISRTPIPWKLQNFYNYRNIFLKFLERKILISRIYYVKFASFNVGNFCARYKVLYIWEVFETNPSMTTNHWYIIYAVC